MQRSIVRVFCIVCLPFLLTGAGCGDGRVAVEGEVTFDGQPVEKGTIAFEPADGAGPMAGGEIQDGRYVLSGDAAVIPGEKIVRITAVRKTGRRLEAGPPEPPGTMVDELERYIPPEYNTQSTLTCEITADGRNQHDFAMESR